jgi:hypothetical protein
MKPPEETSRAEQVLAKEREEAGLDNETPLIYYDTEKRDYLQKNSSGRWVGFNQAQIRRRLRTLGFSNKTEGDFISPVEKELNTAENDFDVRYAAPLAGRKAGFYEENGIRFLVTESPTFITPESGKWPTIERVLHGLFLDQDGENGAQQLRSLYGWLHQGATSLREGQFTQAQALAICGPANCGKSLLQKLITHILGGRAAKGARYMMGKTEFNAELFEAEHIMLEDEHMSKTMRDRIALGAQIKNVTVSADTVSCHRKSRTAINLGAWWRISITLNDNPEALTVLPPLNEDFADKIILLRASRFEMPMATHTPQLKKEFWEQLIAELPAFLDYILNHFAISSDEIDERYGVKTWHHPTIVENLHEISPEAILLKLIDHTLWSFTNEEEWLGTADELRSILISNDAHHRDAAKLLDYDTSTGTYLSRLANNPATAARVTNARTSAARLWKISKETKTVS